MKCVRIFILAALAASVLSPVSTGAQEVRGSITIKARENLLNKLPEQVAYFLPWFQMADVVSTDGSLSSGRLNICLVDNSVRFIHTTGDTLLLANADRVQRIMVGDTVLLQTNGFFVKQLLVYGTKSLAEKKELSIERQSEYGGYSSIPATSTARKGNMTAVDPNYVNQGEGTFDYRLKTTYVLTDGDEVYRANLSAFARIFPEKKKEIRSYAKSHKTDFDSKISLMELFYFCIE